MFLNAGLDDDPVKAFITLTNVLHEASCQFEEEGRCDVRFLTDLKVDVSF